MRALGDGKTYVLKVETGQPWSYIQRFATEAGVRRTYDLPVSGFEPVGMFLDPVPGAPPLDPSTISRVALYILDKQEGRSNSSSVPSTLQAEGSEGRLTSSHATETQ